MLDTISLVPTTPIILALTMVAGVILLYAFSENTHIEQVSLGTLTLLLVFLHVVPLRGEDGAIVLGAGDILQGFASPALMTVLAFLVMGQGLMQTGSLDRIADKIFDLGVKYWLVLTAFILFAVTIMSGFLNNTPMVVIFIPIMQALAQRFHLSPSMVMMPLSFAAILGGMTTLIGSSTNILVSSTMGELGYGELDFFEFTIPGLLLAGVGFLYITFVAPYLLPNRADMAGTLFQEEKGKQFIAQITVPAKSKLIGESSRHGRFPSLKDVTVRMILRGEHSEVPPYDDFALEAGDVLVIATTGKMLADLVSSDDVIVGEGYLDSFSYGQTSLEEGEETGRILSEVMVVPASSMIGNTLERIGFRYRFGGIVLGLRRRERILSRRLTEIRLEAGDILLVMAKPRNMKSLSQSTPRDLMVIERSTVYLPTPIMARRAYLILCGTIALIASDTLSTVAASTLGAVTMLATQVVTANQAARAIDRRIVLLIGAGIALGTILERTGSAAYLAHVIVYFFSPLFGPVGMLSLFFLLVTIVTNLISNNACALIFTPIAVNTALTLNIDPIIFAITVILASNCCFITPIGYQTNVLVMGPGHYRFGDFINVGLPLALLMWIAFTLFVPWYYGLWS